MSVKLQRILKLSQSDDVHEPTITAKMDVILSAGMFFTSSCDSRKDPFGNNISINQILNQPRTSQQYLQELFCSIQCIFRDLIRLPIRSANPSPPHRII